MNGYGQVYLTACKEAREERDEALCETCHGEGAVETTIGGDGYGDRCAGLADVPIVCPDCEGTGKSIDQEVS